LTVQRIQRGKKQVMETHTSGTFVGAGSFRCQHCGYALTLEGTERLTDCPSCGGSDFVRASLFSTERVAPGSTTETSQAHLVVPATPGLGARLADARAHLSEPGQYLVYEDSEELLVVGLTREWTRIGRSLAADVRFDDPTVSRRHALIVRSPDGVRLLDDRSLNGVYVNGSRIDGRVLEDGDEIIVGRYRLTFLSVSPDALLAAGSDPGAAGSA
jgi:FHA domain/Zinc-ribbon containing domain